MPLPVVIVSFRPQAAASASGVLEHLLLITASFLAKSVAYPYTICVGANLSHQNQRSPPCAAAEPLDRHH